MVTIPPVFYWDHVERDCSAGKVIKRTKTSITVEFDQAGLRDLYTDAQYYSDSWAFDPHMRGLCSSARATVRALDRQIEWQ